MRNRVLLIVVVAILALALDQATNLWARSSLRGKPAVTLIPGYLDLEYHENPGSAFGLLRSVPGARYILIGVGVVALVVVWRMVSRIQHRRRIGDVAFALGRVVDFILMHFHRKYVWPAYNVADIALVVGVGLLILVLGRRPDAAPARGRRSKSTKGKKK
jgi:signal peptidase II